MYARKFARNDASMSRVLEELYLGPAGDYELELPVTRVKEIEGIFDRIISRHGLREVAFSYSVLEEPDESSLVCLRVLEKIVPPR